MFSFLYPPCGKNLIHKLPEGFYKCGRVTVIVWFNRLISVKMIEWVRPKATRCGMRIIESRDTSIVRPMKGQRIIETVGLDRCNRNHFHAKFNPILPVVINKIDVPVLGNQSIQTEIAPN